VQRNPLGKHILIRNFILKTSRAIILFILKFVAISDTHSKHNSLQLPIGDVLIHTGDVSSRGKEYEVLNFLEWFSAQDYAYKIFIAGNHDFYFEQMPLADVEKIIPDNVIYLNDSSIKINGINIWGSPISPWFYDWAFNRHRGDDIQKHWDKIPMNTDILLTHGPAFGILDRTVGNMQVGCEDLLRTIKIIKPQVHICGHIHEAYGQVKKDATTFINASVLNERYLLSNEPIVFGL
jgi:Icc-related predicted phosphoesterase